MRSMSVLRLLLTGFLAVLCVASVPPIQAAPPAATIIDTTPAWDGWSEINAFGKPDTATYGQTITVPMQHTLLKNFTFYMRVQTNVTFRGYVYAWDGTKAVGPALYESADTSTTDETVLQPITFNTGAIPLVAGQQYVLFASISKLYADNPYSFGYWGYIPQADAYPEGKFVFHNNGDDFNRLTTETWDGVAWGPEDLAFKVTLDSLNVAQTKDDCKNDGWRTHTRADGSKFKNQGDCIRYVNTGK